MTIEEFSIITQKELVIKYNYRLLMYQCYLDGSEIKESGCLISKWGAGKTPDEAINDYISQIVGKTLVFNAYVNRQEFSVPITLSYKD